MNDEPTPEEIRQRCREIQETWTPWQERRRRGADREGPHVIPTVRGEPGRHYALSDAR